MIYGIEPIFRQTILVSQTNKTHTYKHTLIIRFLPNELDAPKGHLLSEVTELFVLNKCKIHAFFKDYWDKMILI